MYYQERHGPRLGWFGELMSGCCKNCVLGGLEMIHHRRLQLFS
jgi:hypothetical protein